MVHLTWETVLICRKLICAFPNATTWPSSRLFSVCMISVGNVNFICSLYVQNVLLNYVRTKHSGSIHNVYVPHVAVALACFVYIVWHSTGTIKFEVSHQFPIIRGTHYGPCLACIKNFLRCTSLPLLTAFKGNLPNPAAETLFIIDQEASFLKH